MRTDDWTICANMHSEQQTNTFRAEVVTAIKSQFDINISNFTCDGCDARYSCPLVFDPYNTNGDCLMEK